MTLLWINLALVFAFSYFARYAARPVMATGSTAFAVPVKPNKMLAFGALLTLILISGLRSGIGDTFFYKHSYEINDFTWSYILGQKDIGFGILQMFLKQISKDPQILIFTTALITNLLIVIVLYNYARIFELSLYVYITGGLFLVSMNGIRQTLAAAIAFTSIRYLMNGNLVKYTLIVLFASFFHQSVLILLPIYFVVRVKAWSRMTMAILLMSVLVVAAFDQFSMILFSALEGTQYGNYKNIDEGGANFIRVIVEAVPLAIAFLGREKLREIFPRSDVVVNMALLSFVFMLISTQNWIYARFAIYFWPYQLILLSWIVKLFRERDQKLIYYGILVCYFAYYYFENVLILRISYHSDYLFW